MNALILLLLCLAAQGAAQDPKARQKAEEQEERLRDLEKKVQEVERRQADTTSANPLNVLNPRLTVIGNFLWRLDDQHVLAEAGDGIDDTASVREVEIDLRASIDPYADGVAVLSLESEVPGAFEAGVEEFYVNVKSLPFGFWESPPLGAKIKFGRFRTEVGRNNRMHLHDLPQSDRPVVLEEFFGEEGHISGGGSAQLFLPSPGETALELAFQALQGGGIAEDPNHSAYLANLRWYVPISDEHSFDVSLIGFYGTHDAEGHRQSRMTSVDFLYRWKPLRQGEYRSIVVGGQAFRADHEFHQDVDTDGDGIPDATTSADSSPFGYYVWGQVQLSQSLYAGVRWDQTDVLANDSQDRRRISPYISYYLSEFFRVRLSYQRTTSDIVAEDGRDTFLLELNVVFGSHPPEPFWVNR